MRNRWVVIVLAFLGCVIAGAAAAQDTGGTLAGRTVDAQGLPLPGVAVTVTGAQGAKTAVSDADGRFTVPFLTPGPYTVHAELQGFAPIDRTDIQVGLGQRIDLPLTLRVGSLQETIEVVATPPTVDTTSTTIGASLDSGTLSRLPVGRRFSDTLYLAPGVSTGGSVGVANPSIEGSSGLENQYVVDGVNITNGGYGALGSYSIVFGSLGNGTPFDFMQEVQVKTGGYEAEFGQATGGVINVVTKSGSNALKGSAFGYARPLGLESSYDTVTERRRHRQQRPDRRLSDVGATVGGPILRDRLFFFGAIDPQWQTDDVHRARRTSRCTRSAGSTATAASTNYAAKGPGSRRARTASTCRSSATRPRATTGRSAPSSLLEPDDLGVQLARVRRPQPDRPLRRRPEPAFPGRGILRARAEPDRRDAVGERVAGHRLSRDADASITGGLGFYEAGNRSDSWQAQAKATNIFAAAGEHQVRYGVRLRAPRLQPAPAVHRSDVHRAERPADRDRRDRRHHSRTRASGRSTT